MRRETKAIEQLRRAIDCLPVDTRRAMLEGVRSHEIVVGAYTHDGGVCPMLAAHRCGGRTSFLTFARSWDRFAKARRARRATERELRVLITNLEASLAAEEDTDLGAAIAEHRALLARRPLRLPFRRLAEYERALERARIEVARLREPGAGVAPDRDAEPQPVA